MKTISFGSHCTHRYAYKEYLREGVVCCDDVELLALLPLCCVVNELRRVIGACRAGLVAQQYPRCEFKIIYKRLFIVYDNTIYSKKSFVPIYACLKSRSWPRGT